MKRNASSFLWLIALGLTLAGPSVSPLAAQGTLFFSMEGTECAFNSLGGNVASPGNWAAVFRNEAILMISPASGASANSCADRATWTAHFGDDDGDSNYTESILGRVDALHLRAGAANPPSVFDFWLSATDDVIGPFGSTGFNTVLDGDIFRILPGGGVERFLSEAQVASAIGTFGNINVDAFAVNDATGDIYLSFSTPVTIGGVVLEDGGLARIAGNNITLSPALTVASVVPGSAEIVLPESYVNIYFLLAGQGSVGDLHDIALAPGGGTFNGLGGITLPNMWFTGSTSTTGAVVVTTTGGVASLNGVALQGGPAFGLRPTDFTGLPNSHISGLAVGPATLTQKPRFLSISDPGLITPGTLKLDASGCTPGPNLVLLANAATAWPPGLATGRTATALIPLTFGAGSFAELFVDDFSDPMFVFTSAMPPLNVSAAGYASLSVPMPLVAPGFAISLQGIDVSSMSLTTPVVVVTL